MLELRTTIGIVPAKNPQTVPFTEELDKHVYSSIEILLEGKVIATITNIPEVQ